jgi:hypothetical protein
MWRLFINVKLTAGSNSKEGENIKLASSNEVKTKKKTQGQRPEGVEEWTCSNQYRTEV